MYWIGQTARGHPAIHIIEVFMLPDEIDRGCRTSEVRTAVDFLGSGPISTERIEPELATTRSGNVVSYVDFVRNQKDKGLTADRKSQIKGILESETWHLPYAEALMETEQANLPVLITKAERAIFVRYLELCIAPGEIEHSIDLQNAVYHLSQLKKADDSEWAG
jgi:hypothetical protein